MGKFNPSLQQFVGQDVWVKVKFYYSASVTEIYYINILYVDYENQQVDFLYMEYYRMDAILQCATMERGDYNELCDDVDGVCTAGIGMFDEYELCEPIELYSHQEVLDCLENCEVTGY